MKFKPGDRVIALPGPENGYKGEEGVILEVRDLTALQQFFLGGSNYLVQFEFYNNTRTWMREEELIHEEVYNSPLFQALKEDDDK